MAPKIKVKTISRRVPLHRRCKPHRTYSSHSNITLDRLPTEVLQQIFSYLRTYDLCYHVRPVCHRFQDIVYSQPIWHTVSITKEMSEKMVTTWLSKFGHCIRHISMECEARNNDIIVQLSKTCRHLQTLDITADPRAPTTVTLYSRAMCNLVQRCKCLNDIKLPMVRFTSCKFFKLLQQRSLNGIRHFRYTGPVTIKQVKAVMESLQTCLSEQRPRISIVSTRNQSFQLNELIDNGFGDAIDEYIQLCSNLGVQPGLLY